MVSIPHSDFSLLINLCANALKVPARCASKAVSQASIGFQWNVKQPNSCWELGELSTAKFSYLDEQAPGKGIDIMYAGGTPCSTGVRMIHYHMICAGNDAAAQISAPSFAWESPTCHYHVVWPTVLACSKRRGFSFFAMIEEWFLFLLFAVVVGALCVAFRRQQNDGTPMKETMTDLYSTAADRGFDFVSNVKSRVGGGIGGGATNRPPMSSGSGGSGVKFGSEDDMKPMAMAGDAL